MVNKDEYKDICIFTDILWRVFRILAEPVPYTLVYGRGAHIAICALASLVRRYTDIFTVYDVIGEFSDFMSRNTIKPRFQRPMNDAHVIA